MTPSIELDFNNKDTKIKLNKNELIDTFLHIYI